ncbi:MAG: hypothetical protein SF069_15985 [Phycisphaerae bacterium]|nr:hypothetical protein [Phycisphaerae bacterium]
MMKSATELRTGVLLSVQRALVGEVTPRMRFIGVEFSPQRMHIIVWHDGPVDESAREDFDAAVVTQIVSDFAWPDRGDPQTSFEFVRCDFPQRPNFRGELVYGRSEAR